VVKADADADFARFQKGVPVAIALCCVAALGAFTLLIFLLTGTLPQLHPSVTIVSLGASLLALGIVVSISIPWSRLHTASTPYLARYRCVHILRSECVCCRARARLAARALG
jgi:hypothetical protein